jgi:hypothetical protein
MEKLGDLPLNPENVESQALSNYGKKSKHVDFFFHLNQRILPQTVGKELNKVDSIDLSC